MPRIKHRELVMPFAIKACTGILELYNGFWLRLGLKSIWTELEALSVPNGCSDGGHSSEDI